MSNQQGSVLLLIIGTMSITLFLMATIWRNSVFVYELGLARQEFEQEYWNAQALMNFAIAICKTNYDILSDYIQNQALEIIIEKWPLNRRANNQQFEVSMLFSKKDVDQITIKTQEKKTSAKVLSCELKRTKNEKGEDFFIIENWSIS